MSRPNRTGQSPFDYLWIQSRIQDANSNGGGRLTAEMEFTDRAKLGDYDNMEGYRQFLLKTTEMSAKGDSEEPTNQQLKYNPIIDDVILIFYFVFLKIMYFTVWLSLVVCSTMTLCLRPESNFCSAKETKFLIWIGF